MKIKNAYTDFLSAVKKKYTGSEAAVITDMVFESLLKINKTQIKTADELDVSVKNSETLKIVLQKLIDDVPIQYILGEAWFYNLRFKVSPAMLIPRPETEELAEIVIEYCTKNNLENLLDIGTGSGCIAVAAKKNISACNVSALDFSEPALDIARENAAEHNAEINFIQLDFLAEKNWISLQQYDIIVSNPPYIPLREKEIMDKNVTDHEPHLALFVPDDQPLIFYEKIAAFGKDHLTKNGMIFLETHENFAKEVVALFSEQGYTATIKKDISGKERFVLATHSR